MFNRPTPEQRTQMAAVGVASGLGCSIVVTMILLIGGGVALDQWVGTTPWFTLLGVALGLVAAGYQLYELTLVGRKDRGAGPVGRQIAKLPISRSGSAARDGDQARHAERREE
ncbi:MAG: AtpZ/AtpI family protein [Chloroflexota bacterium]|nr:AtpZ/AtpI family protein [Chloroflexota bacterium]